MMLKEFRSLFRETAVYGLSTVAGRLLNILLLPLYTHCLTKADYGIVATVFAYIAFLNILYAHGMDLAFIRYGCPEKGAEGAKRDFSTPFWSILGLSLSLSVLVHLAAGPLSRAIGLADWERVVRCSAWILALDAVCLVPFAELRLSHRASTFVGIKVANITAGLGLNYLFVARMGYGVEGVFLATLAASGLTVLFLLPAIASKVSAAFDRRLHGELLRFALPLLPAGIATMAIQVADRPMLKAFTDDSTVGLYQANHKLAVFMMMAINMFEMAWRPFYVERERQPQVKDLLARAMTYFTVFTAFILLGVSLFLRDIVALPLLHGKALIHPSYWVGLKVAPVVMLGYLLNGIYYNLNAPVTLAKRTDLIAAATIAGALANIAANALLIPAWGIMGAAASVVVAYGTMSALLLHFTRSAYPVAYEYRRLVRVGLVLAAVAAVALWARVDLKTGLSGLACKLSLLAAFPLGLAATGFLDQEERESLSKAAAKLLGREQPDDGA
ncbi:MAG: oligosaccharide flippase family protein [Elusimicrobia bacterium]|nr:oligosaccharide flippase family protein [Elusimicrobiota bacterium]